MNNLLNTCYKIFRKIINEELKEYSKIFYLETKRKSGKVTLVQIRLSA